jgi:hypothetical protein
MALTLEPFSERIIQQTWNGADVSLFHTCVESEDDFVMDFVQKGPYVD